MKRLFAAIAAMMLVPTMASAGGERFSLSELKAQVPDYWEASYTSKKGRTVAFDAPILMPEADTFPIMRVVRNYGNDVLKEKYGVSVGVLDMHTIKPLDADAILRVAQKTGNVVTIEDHSINGGLGSAVAEVLCEAGYKGSFKRIGMPDEFAVLGTPDEIYHYYGMDRDGIVNVLTKMLQLGK